MKLRTTFLFLICFLLGVCSRTEPMHPSLTPSATPSEQATSSLSVTISESTALASSEATEEVSRSMAMLEIDHEYIPGTTAESEFPILDKDQMWPLRCALGEIVVPEAPIPYGDTGYEITAYAKDCRFGEGKIIENIVLGLRNVENGSQIFFNSRPIYGEPFAPQRLIGQYFRITGVTERTIIFFRFGYKNASNVAIWIFTNDYAKDATNAQPNLEEFAQTGDPSVLKGEWFIPGFFVPQQ